MKIALLQNDKSFLSFDLKDLLWLILVVGVWATQDYRIKYTNNVLKWNEQLQEKIGEQSGQILQLKEQSELGPPDILNIIRLQSRCMDKLNQYVRDFPAMSKLYQGQLINQLEATLDAISEHRDYLAGELERLKAQTK